MFHVKHSIKHIEVSKEELEGVNKLLESHGSLLEEYVAQLLWWNKKINLVSRSVSHETVIEHVKHSLLLYKSIGKDDSNKIVDTGTGGGLPGIPLAICFPEKEFILNDIVEKKLLTVKQMALKLGLKNVVLEPRSIAKMPINSSDLIITKHAFKINELISYLSSMPWRQIIFLKGEEEVVHELEGITDSLEIKITHLDKVIKSGFYKGKAIVEVAKANE